MFSLLAFTGAGAEGFVPDVNPSALDTAKVVDVEEVVVVASPKENIKLRKQPVSVTLFSGEGLDNLGVTSVKDLTGFVHNLYIPDYGSRLTSSVYIRGIGSRMNTPAVGMYVDNMPYIDKSAYDFTFLDIDRIDVLNGPQGTLYGRKAFGTLETGRKGGRVPRLFNAIIYQWMMDKGIHGRPLPYKIQGNHKYSPQERGDRAMAGAIAYTIRKKGTRLYREGGRADVYTPVVRATIRRITDRFAGLVEEMIDNIRLNDIGENRG